MKVLGCCLTSHAIDRWTERRNVVLRGVEVKHECCYTSQRQHIDNCKALLPLQRFRGFGVFYPVVREAGEVRNPRTGEKTRSEERVKISFRPSRELLGELN